MNIISTRQRAKDTLVIAGLVVAAAALVIFPRDAVAAASDAIRLCATVVVPSLFVFFVLSSLALKLGAAQKLGAALERVMRPLFKVNGACGVALALGILGGYPVGARTVTELYKDGICTKDEAERLLAFCNNSGPAFILGAVGSAVFKSAAAGAALLAVHILSAVIVGIIFGLRAESSSRQKTQPAPRPKKSFAEAFTQSVGSGISSSLSVCGYVIFFSVLLSLLGASGVTAMLPGTWAERLISGFLEVSCGVLSLRGAVGSPAALPAAAMMLGWGGLSVHCQALSSICTTDLSPRKYFAGKALHGFISFAAMILPARRLAVTAASAAAETAAGSSDVWMLVAAVGVYAVMVIASLTFFAIKKRARRRGHKSSQNGKISA